MRKSSTAKKQNHAKKKNFLSRKNHPALRIDARRIMAKATVLAICIVSVTFLIIFIVIKFIKA